MEEKKVISLLQKAPIFAKTSEASLEAMLKSAVQKSAETGTKIVEKGQSGVGFYLILDGEAEVTSDGKKLADLRAGSFFGELSVIDGAPRTADVVAKTDVTCLVITQWAMRSLISSHPEIALSMLEELCKRLRSTNRELPHD